MNEIVYAKYSYNRDDKFKIRTLIKELNNSKVVTKKALYIEGNPHIKNMVNSSNLLRTNYIDTKISVCNCNLIDDSTVSFDYIDGKSIENKLDELYSKGNIDEVIALMKDYFTELVKSKGICKFNDTPEYRELFGSNTFTKNTECLSFANIDAIFSNVKKVDENFVFIDYEWCSSATIPLKFLIYRCIFYYLNGTQREAYFADTNLYKYFRITKQEIVKFQKMEHAFQIYVLGDNVSEDLIKNQLDTQTYILDNIREVKACLANRVQIYTDSGNGFSESNSSFVDYTNMPDEKNYFETVIAVKKDTKALRIDPFTDSCLVIIKNFVYTDKSLKYVKFEHNGLNLSDQIILFSEDDPKIIVETKNMSTLQFSGWIIPLHGDALKEFTNYFLKIDKQLEQNDLAIKEMRSTYDINIENLNESYKKDIEKIHEMHNETIHEMNRNKYDQNIIKVVIFKILKIFRRKS